MPANGKFLEVMVGGMRIAQLSRAQLCAQMVEDCRARRISSSPSPKLVFAANGHALSLAAADEEFRRFHDVADIVHADGQPVVLVSQLLTSSPIPERSATTDFFHDAATAAREHGLRFFLLGATEQVNAACAERMRTLYPGLEIAGRHHGYFPEGDEEEVCAEINASGADIVWVGLGVPLEQAFCVRNKQRLRAGWLVTAGGCFNYVTGHYARAPLFMQRMGLEWLHRLCREPARLFWRYFFTNPHAIYLLLTRTGTLAAKRAGVGPEVAEARA